MVAKINTGKNLFGILAYNENKVKEKTAKVIYEKNISKDISATEFSMKDTMDSFYRHLINNKNTKNPYVHISINPDPDDTISDEKLLELTKEYIEKLGYGEHPYVIFEHNDTDRKHLHIVTTNVSFEGKKVNDSFQKRKSMQICRELEKKYNLRVLKNEKEKECAIYLDGTTLTPKNHREFLNNSILTFIDTYHFKTIGEYSALLSTYNISVRYLTGNRYGERFNGIIYQLRDENGKDVSIPIKASLLSEKCGYKSLYDLMVKNQNTFDNKKTEGIKELLDKGLSIANNREDLILFLKKQGINLILRENKETRITGVTYVDHTTRIVYNGSNLGKKYSANAIQEWINEKNNSETILEKDIIPISPIKESLIVNSNSVIEKEIETPPPTTNSQYIGGSLLEDIFNFMDVNTPIYIDENEANKLEQEEKKKKKKKKGRRM